MNTKDLKTDNGVVLDKICYMLSEYYILNDKKRLEIQSFLLQDEENAVIASQNRFVLLTKNSPVNSFTAEPKFTDISGIYVTANKASIIPFPTGYVPNGLSTQKESTYFLANSSNNNNNNNNNNG